MKITGDVADGCRGKSRPQHAEVPDDELKTCVTREERLKLVADCIQRPDD
jgi:hypothetical protein